MKNVCWLFVFALLVSCSSTSQKVEPFSSVNYASANMGALTGKSRIVQKPTLIKLGIQPLTLVEARGYMYNLFNALIPDLEKTNITYQMAGNDILLTIQSHILLDENMNIIEEANHARMIVKFKTDLPLTKDDIMRLKVVYK